MARHGFASTQLNDEIANLDSSSGQAIECGSSNGQKPREETDKYKLKERYKEAQRWQTSESIANERFPAIPNLIHTSILANSNKIATQHVDYPDSCLHHPQLGFGQSG